MTRLFSLSLAIGVSALVACGDDGASTTPSTSATTVATTKLGTKADAGAVATTAASASPSASASTGAPLIPGFVIESSKFADGAALPTKYTCEGNPFGSGMSPELNWSGAPAAAKSFALVFRDKSIVDAGDPIHAYHWGAWNIPVNLTGIAEHLSAGQFPAELMGGEQFRAGPPHDDEFFGPCPSWMTFCSGAPRSNDSYEFVLLAFSEEMITVPAAPTPGPTVNYVANLYAFFESAAIGKAILNAKSDAVPTDFPACPAAATSAGTTAAPVTSSVLDAGAVVDASTVSSAAPSASESVSSVLDAATSADAAQ